LREDTWKAIEQRQKIHDKIHSIKSERIKGKLRVEYTLKDREVKRRAREDRMIWLEKIGCEAEKSAEKGSTREPYQAVRKITNKKHRQVAAVKNKKGEVIKDKE